MEIKGSVDIQRPVEEVFEYMNEPKNNLEWETGVLEMELTSEGPLGVGSRGRRVENYGMGTDESTWVITKHEPNKFIAMDYESDKFIGDGGYDIEPIDGGTRVHYRFAGTPKNPFFRLLMPLMMPMVKGQARRGYGNLKRVLESKG